MGLIESKVKNIDYNGILTVMRKKMYNADIDGDFVTSNEVAAKVKHMKLPFSTLLSLDPENIIFYLNYNCKIAEKGLDDRSTKDRTKLLKAILSVDLNEEAVKIEYVNFIEWSCIGLFDEEDMFLIIKHFCDHVNLHDTNKVLEVYSVLKTTVMFSCIALLEKTRDEIKRKKMDAKNL